MISLPVEPIIFYRKNLVKPSALELAAHRLARKIPGTAGFGINDLICFGLAEKLKNPAIDLAAKSSNRFFVIGQQHDNILIAENIQNRALLFQGVKWVCFRLIADNCSDNERSRLEPAV